MISYFSPHKHNIMAIANGATTMTPKVQIEAMQTVMPMKPTDRQSRRVSIPENLRTAVFRRCLHIVLYYNKTSEEDSGWMVAGWIKESLGNALLEQPMFGGRLKRVDNGDGELEIVSNDSGVRLLEARMAMDLSEFLELRREKEEAEAELVFWEDIDEQSPQFSPLSYVQVTNFNCGGYSIGFSCSLLVADPLTMTSFLKKWANIHNNVISKTEIPKLPIFYLPNLRKTGSSITNINNSVSSKTKGQTLIFKIASSEKLSLDCEVKKTIAALSIEEAEQTLGRETGSNFSLIVKELSEEIKVENILRKAISEKLKSILIGFNSESWDDLGGDEISVYKGNKPARVSYWINSVCDEGLVMVIPYPDKGILGMKIIVTFPKETMI